MYLNIRFSTHKNGDKVPTAVLRKSIRKNGKITHQYYGYLSGLPLETLYVVRDAIKSSLLSIKNNDSKSKLESDDGVL
jgi:hypothetical protein